jgi:hypothetical protein
MWAAKVFDFDLVLPVAQNLPDVLILSALFFRAIFLSGLNDDHFSHRLSTPGALRSPPPPGWRGWLPPTDAHRPRSTRPLLSRSAPALR